MENSGKVLIVDDDASGRATIEALLFGRGYELVFANSGMEALEKAGAHVPDLILLDVMMPDIDGFQVCERLRSDPLLAQVPVVMVTALDDRDSRLRGLLAGADDFVSKPVDGTELRARVRTITQLNRYRRLLTERTRFEWVVEQAADGYVMIDARDEIQYANPQARLYLGIPRSVELASQERPLPTLKFLDVAQRQYYCEPSAAWEDWPPASAGTLSPTRYLVRPESSTARSLWLEVDLLGAAADRSTQLLVHLRDVTARVVQDREIRSFHDLVAHKMRTPLASLLVSLDLLERQKDRFQAKGQGELLASALMSTRRLRDAIEDILQHISTSGLALSGGGFLLSALPAVVAETRDRLNIRSISVVCPPELEGVEITLSRRAVELILWEILENAVKFHPRQVPSVEVEVARVGNAQVLLRVSDDGIVLSPEQLQLIWRPYYQGEKFFTGQTEGVGLGLATVAALVWEAGGTCRAGTRENGPGLVIELHLPVQ